MTVVWALVPWVGLAAPADAPDRPRPGAYELQWDAPENCPDAAAIRAAVEDLLHSDPEGEGVMQVRARVTAPPPTWALSLETEFEGTVDMRELNADSCAELGGSVALVIAAALDPALDPAAEPGVDVEPEPETEPEPEPAPPTVTETRVSEDPARPAPAPPSVRLRGDLGPEWGALSGIAANLGLTLTAHWKPARLELSGRWIGLRRTEGPGESQLAAQLFVVALRGCYQLHRGAWEFPLCGGLEAGAVRLDRRRFEDDSAVHGPWLAPLVAGVASRRFGRVSLWIEAQVAIRARGTVATSGGRDLFSPAAPVSLRPLVGIEVGLS